MKVAFVVPRYGDGIVGGAETLARGLAEHLASEETPVEVVTTTAKSHLTWRNDLQPGIARERGVTVRRFPLIARAEHAFDWLQQRIQRGERLPLEDQLRWAEQSVPSPELYEYLASRGGTYDLVCFVPYLFGPTLRGVGLVPRAVVIPCLHNEPFAHLEVVHAAFAACHGFIFNSQPEAELAQKLYGLGDRPWGVVGLGFDPSPPGDPQGFCRRHRLTGPLLLYMGRKETGKSVPLLIEYARRYRETHRGDVTLVLAGDGPVTVARQTEAVRDLGYLNSRDKPSAYAAATILCQPSLNESFSIVLMEAWLAGKPVLVHARCPVTTHHVFAARGGLTFGDFYEFAETLTYLLANAALRDALGAQGRTYVETEYAWPAVTARLRETLERLVD